MPRNVRALDLTVDGTCELNTSVPVQRRGESKAYVIHPTKDRMEMCPAGGSDRWGMTVGNAPDGKAWAREGRDIVQLSVL